MQTATYWFEARQNEKNRGQGGKAMIIGIHEEASKRMEESKDEQTSQRGLWCAVLLQAIEDWRSSNARRRAEAEKFFFNSPKDFERVCRGAGLEATSVIAKLQKMKATMPQSYRPMLHQQAA
jgi:hypothetical protein